MRQANKKKYIFLCPHFLLPRRPLCGPDIPFALCIPLPSMYSVHLYTPQIVHKLVSNTSHTYAFTCTHTHNLEESICVQSTYSVRKLYSVPDDDILSCTNHTQSLSLISIRFIRETLNLFNVDDFVEKNRHQTVWYAFSAINFKGYVPNPLKHEPECREAFDPFFVGRMFEFLFFAIVVLANGSVSTAQPTVV